MYARSTIAIFAALALSAPVLAIAGGQDYYQQHERGWFWYERQPEPEEQPPPLPPQPPQVQSASSGPPALSTAWIRENLQRFLDKAIDNPSPENVEAYAYLNRLMMDRGSRFSDAMARAVLLDPALDENSRRPLSTFGGREVSRLALENKAQILKDLAQAAGVYFFFEPSTMCVEQARVLAEFADQYGFSVFPISMTGQPLPGSPFPKFHTDNGQAAAIGVQHLPAMYLVRPQAREFLNLGQTMLSGVQIAERILLAAHEAGWVSDDSLASTRPQLPTPPLAPQITQQGQKDLGPAELLRMLRVRQGAQAAE